MIRSIRSNAEDGKFQYHYEWDTLNDLYKIRRGLGKSFYKSNRIWGTLLGGYCAIWELLFSKIGDGYDVSKWKIKDGYFLTLVSPLILIWWGFITVLLLLSLIMPIVFLPLVFLWTLFFEFPATILNMPLKNKEAE